jgi:hypothetical protein
MNCERLTAFVELARKGEPYGIVARVIPEKSHRRPPALKVAFGGRRIFSKQSPIMEP